MILGFSDLWEFPLAQTRLAEPQHPGINSGTSQGGERGQAEHCELWIGVEGVTLLAIKASGRK